MRFAPGTAMEWAGQFAELARARHTMLWVIPATLGSVLFLLHAYFRRLSKALLILSVIPFALIGGGWLTYMLGYQFSVAVAVGFIALAGVAAEFGVVMLLYIDQALAARGAAPGNEVLRDAVVEGRIPALVPR